VPTYSYDVSNKVASTSRYALSTLFDTMLR